MSTGRIGRLFRALGARLSRGPVLGTRLPDGSEQNGTDGECLEEEPPPITRGKFQRRKSVAAERYDPEADDDDDVQKVVHPKSDEQRKRLENAVKNILLFRALDKEQMDDILDAMFEKKVCAGDHVIDQGDDGDNFYVIDSGKYDIYIDPENGGSTPDAEAAGDQQVPTQPSQPSPDAADGRPASKDADEEAAADAQAQREARLKRSRKVGEYDGEGSFGELALMYNMPRAATVITTSSGVLWALDRTSFRRILMKSAFKKRRTYEQLIENVPMLKTLESYERMNLADALVPRSFTDETVIIKQGDPADGMYFVEQGQVSVTLHNEKTGETTEVTKLGRGSYFGELALLTSKPRAATVTAAGDCKVAYLDVNAFERLLGPCMDLMKRNIDSYTDQIKTLFGNTKL